MKKPPRICIVGLKCYDLISGNPQPRYLGGIESMLVFLAKSLVTEGCEVSLVTYDQGQPEGEVFDGVRIFKAFNPETGVRGLRWISHARRLWETMRRTNADFYLQMGAGVETGLVALGCRDRGQSRAKRFVFCLAHDSNFSRSLRAGRFGWEGKIYQYGLRRADLIVSQTERQREGLRAAVGLDSDVITIAAASSPTQEPGPVSKPAQNRVLWAGRIVADKRLEWLIEVARHCPDVFFDVAGAPNTASKYASDLVEEAGRLANVRLHGRVGADQMNQLYQGSRLFCNTSTAEGFPNTYPEAWSRGLPVVATFDPDGLVARHNLGRIASTVDGLVDGIQELLGNEQTCAEVSRSARRYFDQNHSTTVVARKFCSVFGKLPINS